MNRLCISHVAVLGFLAATLLGCGAAATLPPENGLSNLKSSLTQAVWYPEFGDQIQVSDVGTQVRLEDGSVSSNSITVQALDSQSSYVHGVFLLDIPDEEGVSISADIGFSESSPEGTSARFTIYIQDEGRFVPLAEMTAFKDGRLDPVSADLSPYRGQNRMLVFSASSEDGSALSVPVVWVAPELHIP